MKLAVSNIAWTREDDAGAYEVLLTNGIETLEIAPTRVWPEWRGIDQRSIGRFRRQLDAAGIRVSSMQSIFFQKPGLRLFGSEEDRRAMYGHFCYCADLGAALGAECLVFGSPRNRLRESLSEAEAFAIAVDLFSAVGEYYAARGVRLGIEANPQQYGCDFITDSRTAVSLVRAVNSPGIVLHLDTGCLQLAGESPADVIRNNSDIVRHFHISEPFLGPFSVPSAAHTETAHALRSTGYQGFAVLEMRPSGQPLVALRDATACLRRMYGDGN